MAPLGSRRLHAEVAVPAHRRARGQWLPRGAARGRGRPNGDNPRHGEAEGKVGRRQPEAEGKRCPAEAGQGRTCEVTPRRRGASADGGGAEAMPTATRLPRKWMRTSGWKKR
jgi:hypothetical protein